jgi:hypothetical protein
MAKRKPILSLDFDGVIHSYTSGWKGPRVIPDPPVPGALEFIVRALDCFDVQIYSSRSNYWGGRRAMRRWLKKELASFAPNLHITPDWLRSLIAGIGPDPWQDEVRYAVNKLVSRIGFPKHKPPAMITLDDRALTFDGQWPDLDTLAAFKPWYKTT